MNTSIYQNIATRTAGDIYIGVVGPVRTGKSTFIKRFMETQVIPNIDNVYRKERARDELPQSGSGRTIMTAEPKFVPEEAAQIQLPDGASFSVRLIDCVGYMVKGAIGQMEDDTPRMVTTPWYDHEIPMTEAAEIGTRKVIAEHSTIGIVITTDGSITDIPREDYLEPEARSVGDMKQTGKPFLVLLNSMHPEAADETGAELYEIRSTERTQGTLGFWWCGRYGMHHWAMPIEPISVDLAAYDHVTICSPIWVFALAAPVRAFCQAAAGQVKEVDYILVHHNNSPYENAAQEMDALLGLHRTGLRSVCCRKGRYHE